MRKPVIATKLPPYSNELAVCGAFGRKLSYYLVRAMQ